MACVQAGLVAAAAVLAQVQAAAAGSSTRWTRSCAARFAGVLADDIDDAESAFAAALAALSPRTARWNTAWYGWTGVAGYAGLGSAALRERPCSRRMPRSPAAGRSPWPSRPGTRSRPPLPGCGRGPGPRGGS